MPISISTIVVGAHLVVAVADQVPAFDISRSCKLDTAATGGLSVDQSLKNCVNDENLGSPRIGEPVVQNSRPPARRNAFRWRVSAVTLAM